MRRLLNPTVALATFLIGIFSVAIWLVIPQQDSPQSKVTPAPLPVMSVPLQTSPETEQYAVYSALIQDMYVEEGIKLIVIGQESDCQTPSDHEKVEDIRYETEEYAIKNLPELERETIDNFRAKSKECQTLSRQLDVPINYVLVTDKELEPLFPEGEFDRAWSRFYAKYPDSSGIINFSNTGINRSINQALVSTGRSCGGLCGAGYFVLLTKEQGIWKVHSKVNTWVS